MASGTLEKTLHYVAQSVKELSAKELKPIAKSPKFKELLLALAEADPATMTAILKEPIDLCTAGKKRLR